MARHRWPPDTVFQEMVLTPTDRSCPTCGGFMPICDHRHRRFYTFESASHLTSKRVHCTQPDCPTRPKTYSSPEEMSLALPGWLIGWDVFSWIGHRRFARDWSIPQIQTELRDSHGIGLSIEGLCTYARRYQTLGAARHQDPLRLKADYADVDDLILTIDGLQPEKGHETLYVVRELRRRRVWFATPLLSSATAALEGVLREARQWAAALEKPIAAWVSDKQQTLVNAIAQVFPGLPHRYCHNHFLRGLAKPTMQDDNHAKVQMRRTVRGLRAIEREVSQTEVETAPATKSETPAPASAPETLPVSAPDECAEEPPADSAASVVLDYCSATRGVLNANHGGPLDPPGLRMDEGLAAIDASIQRCLDAEKGGSPPEA